MLQAATREASAINHDQDLSSIRVGLHDEIFQGAAPVLTGVDAQSTYCYILAAERHRDADTWGVHLLDAAEQGLQPDYTIADAGQGLRAGQKAAWGDTPCHGDVFHIQRQCEGLATTLSRLATGATSRRKTLQAQTTRAGQQASTLADPAGPGIESTPASLTRGGELPPALDTLRTELRPTQAGRFRAPCVTLKGSIPNHASSRTHCCRTERWRRTWRSACGCRA